MSRVDGQALAWSERAVSQRRWLKPPERDAGTFSTDVAVFEQLRAVARAQSSATALHADAFKLSYGELLHAAEGLGEAMLRQRPVPGLVAIALQAPGWTPVAILACLRNGTLCLILDPRDPPARRLEILADAKPTLILTEGDSEEFASTGVTQLSILEAVSSAARPFGVRASPDVHAPALVIYTSGSTGTPKGVVQSQHGLLERVRQEIMATGMCPQDVVMPLCGQSTIAGCREMLCSLLSGAQLRVDRWNVLGVREIGELIARARASVVYAVPSLARLILTPDAKARLTSVRVLRLGGESVRREDLKAAWAVLPPQAQVEVTYSSTETPGASWVPPRGELADTQAEVAMGPLWPGCAYAIVDEHGRSVAEGEPGELVICSPFVALGHWRDGRLTTEAFPREPRHPHSRTWTTGDWVRDEGRGLLRHLGRRDRQRKVHGLRVDLGGVEAQLRAVQGVAEAIALITPEGELVVFVTCRVGQVGLLASDIAAATRASSPHRLQPARVAVLDAVPRLLSGKVDLRALEAFDARKREALVKDVGLTGGITSGDPALTLAVVMVAWRSLLPQSRGEDQSFEEAGGDSLTLLNLVLQLEKGLHRQLPLEQFQPSMTPRGFAEAIDSLWAAGGSDGGAPSSADERPTVFFLPGMHGDVPASARFRARLEAEVAFAPLRYPALQSIASAFPTLEELGRAMADEICTAQPSGPLRLLGYSLGGAVAFEAARELLRRDREIAFIGVLDTSLHQEERPVGLRVERLGAEPGRRLLIIQRNLCRRLSRLAAAQRRGALLLWALSKAPVSPKTRALMVLEAEGELRVLALRAWTRTPRAPLPLKATLFRSEQWRLSTQADLGWGPYFQGIVSVDFDGGHVQCLDDPHAAANAARFIDALSAPAALPASTSASGRRWPLPAQA